jgi:hypothetical protein
MKVNNETEVELKHVLTSTWGLPIPQLTSPMNVHFVPVNSRGTRRPWSWRLAYRQTPLPNSIFPADKVSLLPAIVLLVTFRLTNQERLHSGYHEGREAKHHYSIAR